MNTLENSKLFPTSDVVIDTIGSIHKEHMHRHWVHRRIFPKKQYKIIYNLKGEYIAHVNGKHYHIRENDVFYAADYLEYYSNSVTEEQAGICVYFNIMAGCVPGDSFFRECHLIRNCEKLKNKFLNILNEHDQKSFNYKLSTKKLLYDILDNLMKISTNESNSVTDYYALKKTISYMESNYTDDVISIDYLANLCNYTPTHFTNLFKKFYNMTPKKYLINLKIEKAKDLLIYSSYSIIEISNLVGYSNPTYFSAAFKAVEGCSPLQYRKKNN